MRHPDLADRDDACLLVIDVQERFRSVICEWERLLENCSRLARGARLLGMPVLVTTQNARRLGPIVPELAEALGDFEPLDKLCFSCCGAAGFLERLRGLKRSVVVVCGLETHVCVSQTVLDLLEHGCRVHVAADAVSSRSAENRQAGLAKMARAGAICSTTEMVLFELLCDAGAPEFRAVQALIK